MRMRSREKARGGFTLIELLASIAIIGILAGLLLPALRRAREAGRRAACANNVREIAATFLMYLSDYRGIFPPSFYYAGMQPDYCWYEILNDEYLENQNVFYCLTDRDPCFADGTISYGYNFYPTGFLWTPPLPEETVHGRRHIRCVRYPSETILVGDGEGTFYRSLIGPSSYFGDLFILSGRHNGGSQHLFCGRARRVDER